MGKHTHVCMHTLPLLKLYKNCKSLSQDVIKQSIYSTHNEMKSGTKSNESNCTGIDMDDCPMLVGDVAFCILRSCCGSVDKTTDSQL